jgi:membrane-bound metal-dependent hydrolase YbcI (DUF457 family)
MTRTGHFITTIATTTLVATLLWTGKINNPYPSSIELIVFLCAGALLGSSAPDWLEFSYNRTKIEGRLIPHRTLTHYLPIWLGLIYWIWVAQPISIWQAEVVTLSFLASGVLHILVDACSVSGVPLLTPFGKHKLRVSVYTTGKMSESLVMTVYSAIMLGFAWNVYQS